MKKWWSIFFSAIASCALICTIGVSVKASGETDKKNVQCELSNVQYQEMYDLNEEISIPNATLCVDGENKVANAIVITPSGAHKSSSVIKLSEEGRYTIRYSAIFDEKIYSKDVSFQVRKTVFEVAGRGSAKYDTYSFLTSKRIKTHPANKGYDINKSLENDITGLIVSLNPGDVFKYNQVIDLTENTREDKLLSLNILPTVIGETNFQQLTLKLTDIYDPDNYLTVTVRDIDVADEYAYSTCFLKAAPAGMALVGQWGEDLLRSAEGGTPIYASFHGFPINNVPITEEYLSIAYDSQDKAVYALGRVTRAGEKDASSLIADFDNYNFFDGVWEGFTTGEVYLSIEASIYSKSSADFVITQIQGCDDLSAHYLDDTSAPSLNIEFGEYSETNYPQGEAGKKYKVFPATAFDKNSGECKVITEVYRDYYSFAPTLMQIENGVFEPKYPGDYAIVYKTQDAAGNAVEKVLPLKIYNKGANPITVTPQVVQNVLVGKTVYLNQPSIEGGYGEKKVNIYAVHEQSGKEYAVNENIFVPMQTGVYTLWFEAEDYVGQKGTAHYLLNVAENEEPVFLGDVEKEIPQYLLTGYAYELPKLNAYDFISNSEIESEIKVSNGDLDGKTFIPNTTGTVTISYEATANGKTATYSIQRTVYSIANGEMLDFNKLFVCESGIQASYEELGSIQYATYAANKDSVMEFINPLNAGSFTSTINIIEGKDNFDCVNVYLTDSNDVGNIVKMSFVNKGGQLYFSVYNNTPEVYIGNTIDNELQFSYANSEFILKCKSLAFTLDTAYDGGVFEGFKSDKILYSIEFIGVRSTGVKIAVKDVCGQPLTNRGVDRIKPIITVKTDVSGIYPLNSVLTIGDIIVGDVISPTLNDVTVTVRGPKGILTTTDGVSLKGAPIGSYKILLSEYGAYQIIYEAEDFYGNKQKVINQAIVMDSEAPQAKITGEYAKTAKKGDSIKIAKVTVSDNITEAEGITVLKYYQMPNGLMEAIKGDSFTAEESGVYTVYYYITDAAGNYNIVSYTVIVS